MARGRTIARVALKRANELDQLELDQAELDQLELDQAELDQLELDQAELDQLELDQAELDQAAKLCDLFLSNGKKFVGNIPIC